MAFFEAFVRYARTKQTLLGELQQAFEKNPELRSHSRELINGAFDLVIDRGKEAGVIRDDVDGSDVTQLVSPVCTNPAISDRAGRAPGVDDPRRAPLSGRVGSTGLIRPVWSDRPDPAQLWWRLCRWSALRR